MRMAWLRLEGLPLLTRLWLERLAYGSFESGLTPGG